MTVNISVGGSSSTATNVSSTNNSFTILLNPAVRIPQTAKNVKVFLRSLHVPYSFVNISSALGNNAFYFTDNPSVQNKIALQFDNGLYSLSQYNNILQIKLQNIKNVSGYAFDNNFISFLPDSATDKTFLVINSSGYQVNWPAGSPYGLFGFNLNRRTPSGASLTTSEATYFTGDSTAVFKNVTDLCVQTSLPTNYYYAGQSRNLLGVVPVDVPPQQTIVYPGSGGVPEFNKMDCNLTGTTLSSINVALLDQSLNNIDLNGKHWSLTLNIEYDLE